MALWVSDRRPAAVPVLPGANLSEGVAGAQAALQDQLHLLHIDGIFLRLRLPAPDTASAAGPQVGVTAHGTQVQQHDLPKVPLSQASALLSPSPASRKVSRAAGPMPPPYSSCEAVRRAAPAPGGGQAVALLIQLLQGLIVVQRLLGLMAAGEILHQQQIELLRQRVQMHRLGAQPPPRRTPESSSALAPVCGTAARTGSDSRREDRHTTGSSATSGRKSP